MSTKIASLETLPVRGVELRHADSRGFVVGMVCPWGEISNQTEFPEGERFARGAFADAVRDVAAGVRLPVVLDHDERQQVGWIVHLEDVARGLLGGMRFDSTPVGHRAARSALDGPVGLSVGFHAREVTRGWDGARVVVRGDLVHVSFVGLAAYGSARTYPTQVPALATRSALQPVRSHVLPQYRDLWQ